MSRVQNSTSLLPIFNLSFLCPYDAPLFALFLCPQVAPFCDLKLWSKLLPLGLLVYCVMDVRPQWYPLHITMSTSHMFSLCACSLLVPSNSVGLTFMQTVNFFLVLFFRIWRFLEEGSVVTAVTRTDISGHGLEIVIYKDILRLLTILNSIHVKISVPQLVSLD